MRRWRFDIGCIALGFRPASGDAGRNLFVSSGVIAESLRSFPLFALGSGADDPLFHRCVFTESLRSSLFASDSGGAVVASSSEIRMGHILWALDFWMNRVEHFSSVRGGEVLPPKEPLRRRRHTVRPIDLCLFF